LSLSKHFLWLLWAVLPVVHSADNGNVYPVEFYPKTLDANCNEGKARLYDECGLQQPIFDSALEKANTDKKTLLIIYGAEWCVWCHTLNSVIKYGYAPALYQWQKNTASQQWELTEQNNTLGKHHARALNEYVSENFVLAHIEGDIAEDGGAVIDRLGYDSRQITFLPYIISVTPSGRYAAHLPAYLAMKKSEFKTKSGAEFQEFDAQILLTALQELRNVAEH